MNLDIYDFSEYMVAIIFPLTWFPSIYKVIKKKSAKSFSTLHLLTLTLGFFSNAIYTYSFPKKYIFYMYLFDLFSVFIIIFYKIFY